jgi:hypothetical protein
MEVSLVRSSSGEGGREGEVAPLPSWREGFTNPPSVLVSTAHLVPAHPLNYFQKQPQNPRLIDKKNLFSGVCFSKTIPIFRPKTGLRPTKPHKNAIKTGWNAFLPAFLC